METWLPLLRSCHGYFRWSLTNFFIVLFYILQQLELSQLSHISLFRKAHKRSERVNIKHRHPKLWLWGVIILKKSVCERSAREMWHRDIVTAVIYYITAEFTRNVPLAFQHVMLCQHVMLQRFEFTKVCMGETLGFQVTQVKLNYHASEK